MERKNSRYGDIEKNVYFLQYHFQFPIIGTWKSYTVLRTVVIKLANVTVVTLPLSQEANC